MVGGSETETSSMKKRKSDGRSCSHGNKLETNSSQSETFRSECQSHQYTRSSSLWVLEVFFGLKNPPDKLLKSNFILHFSYKRYKQINFFQVFQDQGTGLIKGEFWNLVLWESAGLGLSFNINYDSVMSRLSEEKMPTKQDELLQLIISINYY